MHDPCARHDIHLGLHTLSGGNVAEFSPYVAPAVDECLRANADLAVRLRSNGSSCSAATQSVRSSERCPPGHERNGSILA